MWKKWLGLDKIEELENKISSLEEKLKTVNPDLLTAVIVKADELAWKQMAFMRVMLENAVLSPKDAAALLEIVDEQSFRRWLSSKNETLPTEVKKFFGDLVSGKSHKDPG